MQIIGYDELCHFLRATSGQTVYRRVHDLGSGVGSLSSPSAKGIETCYPAPSMVQSSSPLKICQNACRDWTVSNKKATTGFDPAKSAKQLWQSFGRADRKTTAMT
jgi:hypothetical protein